MTLKLVAKYADASNIAFLEPQEVARKLSILRGHCKNVGRDYDAIFKTYFANCSIDTDEQKAIQRAEADLNFTRNAGGREYIMQRSLIGTPKQIKMKMREYEKIGIQEIILFFPSRKTRRIS